jgi:hypothetical protein
MIVNAIPVNQKFELHYYAKDNQRGTKLEQVYHSQVVESLY